MYSSIFGGLLGGGLMLLGLPPFGGFASKLLLYQAAMQRGGVYLALLLLCLAYVLPGFVAREPWKSADMTAFGYMHALAGGQSAADSWHASAGSSVSRTGSPT